jgi:hypothetical protein
MREQRRIRTPAMELAVGEFGLLWQRMKRAYLQAPSPATSGHGLLVPCHVAIEGTLRVINSLNAANVCLWFLGLPGAEHLREPFA